MKIRKISAVLVIFYAVLWGMLPASAHHSLAAEFDPNKQITVTGTITRVEWTNPHIYWYLEAKNDATGTLDLWTFEGPPPGMLRRTGVTRDVFKVGEVVTVTAYPAKDGTQHFGFGQKAKYADGHEIYFNRL